MLARDARTYDNKPFELHAVKAAKLELSKPFKDEEKLRELLKEQVHLALELEFQMEEDKRPEDTPVDEVLESKSESFYEDCMEQ